MAGHQERLIEQFKEWIGLGSGRLSPEEHPVIPEPPFVPFRGYRMRGETPVDHGRRTTFIGGMLETLASGPPPLPDRADEPEPEDRCDYRSEFVEFHLMPSLHSAITPTDMEYFFYGLGSTRFPLCFEIIARPGSISLQLCCDRDDADLVARTLEFHLPGLDVVAGGSFLLDTMTEHPGHAIASGDIGLKGAFLLPVQSLGDCVRDPYQGIFAAMTALGPGECAILQVNFQACVHPWAESLLRSVSAADGSPIFGPDSRELVTATRDKIRTPLFAANVRICALADDSEQAASIANLIVSSLSAYTSENEFGVAPDDDRDADDRKVDVALRQFRRSGMILNAGELCALAHIPDKGVHAPALVRQTEKTAPAPEITSHTPDLVLGLNRHRGGEQRVGLGVEERTKHMHVIGASGTGKSTFLLNCLLQDIRNGHGCALLDPHGDLAETVLNHLPEERIQDVVLFDPADEEFPVGFNMLSARSEVEKNLLASDFVSIFRRLSSAWGDQMTAVLGNATLAVLEHPHGGTLIDLRRFLVERGFRQRFLESVEDTEVRYFWKHEFPLLKGNTQMSLLTRLNSFLRQKLIRNMVAQDGRKLDFAEIMDSGKIFLAPLSQGIIGQENSWLLGSLLVSKFYQIALARQTQAEAGRRPFWLYIDEAHNFITDSIASILSGTRKYGLGLVLAHQELDQFGRQNAATLSSILTNSHTRICFRVGDQDARKLQEGFEHFESGDLRKLKTGHAICRIGGSDQDFNLIAGPPPEDPEEGGVAAKARDHSRSRYATPRAEVEKAVTAQTAEGAAALTEEQRARRSKPAKAPPEPEVEIRIPPRPAKDPPEDRPEDRPIDREGHDATSEEPESGTVAEPALSADKVAEEPPEEESSPPASTPPPVKTSARQAGAIPAAAHYKKGRGGRKHKALQEQIKQHANNLGFRAGIEAELPDKSGAVDVLLETQSSQIAIEVALKSPIDQEVRNIAKALDWDVPLVAVISDNATHLGNIREAAELANLGGLRERVRFIHEDEIGEFLNGLRSSIPDSETTNRGYKVRAKYNKLSGTEIQARKDALHRSVNEAERRLQGNE